MWSPFPPQFILHVGWRVNLTWKLDHVTMLINHSQVSHYSKNKAHIANPSQQVCLITSLNLMLSLQSLHATYPLLTVWGSLLPTPTPSFSNKLFSTSELYLMCSHCLKAFPTQSDSLQSEDQYGIHQPLTKQTFPICDAFEKKIPSWMYYNSKIFYLSNYLFLVSSLPWNINSNSWCVCAFLWFQQSLNF